MSDRVSWAMALPDFFGSRGNDVAAVNPDDLRKVWAMMRDLQVKVKVLVAGCIKACSPGANVVAVWYRASIRGCKCCRETH